MATKYNRYKTDFNDLVDEELALVLIAWGGSFVMPVEGELVELFDGDGNECLGFVERVDPNSLIYVRPAWDSWEDAPEVKLPDLAGALLSTAIQFAEDPSATTGSLTPA